MDPFVQSRLTIQAFVASAKKPDRGLVPVKRVHGIAIGHPVVLIIGRQPLIMQARRSVLELPS
jgi:hypothetical protein